MDEKCNFIWEMIDKNPLLRRRILELENGGYGNEDERVSELIGFFREIEEKLGTGGTVGRGTGDVSTPWPP